MSSLSFCVFLNWALRANALRIEIAHENAPQATTLKNVSADEIDFSYMVPAKHKNFDVNIMTYKANIQFQHDIISSRLQTVGAWDEKSVQEFCNKFKKFGGKGNILDVGGNIGSYSIPLAACLKSNGNGNNQLITVEAAPWNNKMLRASMKYNNLDNMHLYEYAVGSPSEPKFVEFVKYPVNAGKSRVAHTGEKGAVQVPLVTIDSIASAESEPMSRIFAMKLDIEGHEFPFLKGGSNFFQKGPCFIFMEMRSADHEHEILQFLMKQHNYVKDGNVNGGTAEAENQPTLHNDWFHRKDLSECIAELN